MSLPMLQLALDHTLLDDALATANRLHAQVDIIEVGTLLCLIAGIEAVYRLRQQHPQKTLVADFKVADAGDTLAPARSYQGDIQIELFGHWTLEAARQWRSLGLTQAIYHRGRDAQASGQRWSSQDLDAMKALSDMGFALSVTGGITPAELPQFCDIDVKAFIAGRALSDSADGAATAREFHQAIADIWGK